MKLINAILKYFWYLLKHKFWVAYYCFCAGLYWRGVKHDLGKFHPREFIPYILHFYFVSPEKALSTHYHKSQDISDERFNRAHRIHVRTNSHHWEFYVDVTGRPEIMDFDDVEEMIADWRGAAKSKKRSGSLESTKEWYLMYRDNIILHPDTRTVLEHKIGLEPEIDKIRERLKRYYAA